MNQPDYQLSDIEDYFNAQRAKARWANKMLDSTDWQYMLAWQKDGVPFSVICRGIDEVFSNHVKRNAPGKINTIRYCEHAIKEYFKNHLEAHVGGHNGSETGHESEFGEARITESLQGWINELKEIVTDTEPLQNAVFLAVTSLQNLLNSFSVEASENLETLDVALLKIEDQLTAALIGEAEEQERLTKYRAEIENDLASYREKFLPQQFEQTVQNALNKKLREEYKIPRLSLFYL